jgi:hypothetical protein
MNKSALVVWGGWVQDPNTFGGPVRLKRFGDKEWTDIPVELPYGNNSRGVGVAETAKAIRDGGMHRANGQLAFHVLEAMHGFHISSNQGTVYRMQSNCAVAARNRIRK